MRTQASVFAVVAAAVVTTGCLQADVTETWYLDNAGTVTWVVQERDVRSDAQSTPDRLAEENEYWLAVQQERHDIAQGLRELGGAKLRTIVLRSEAPFDVRTEAKFTGLDAIGARLIAAVGGAGTSIVTRQPDKWEWTLVVRDPAAVGGSVEPTDAVSRVFDGLHDLKVVLATGRFVGGEGFDVSNDGRVASLNWSELEKKTQDQPAITLRLSWKPLN